MCGGAVSVVPSVDGSGIDPEHLAEQLLDVLTAARPRASVTAELGPVPADFTTEEAQALGIREEISSFTTNFTSAASGDQHPRGAPRRSTARWSCRVRRSA